MALRTGRVWAIDVGSSSLKALHLSIANDQLEVIGFDYIQHDKILTGSGVKAAECNELIALSLREFRDRNSPGKDDVIISVPSQNSFARFVKLPPVEKKRIPEIVKFEAAQQIPFDINDVQWDWQLMSPADSKEVHIGLFAIKNDIVSSELEHFSRANIAVSYVQMAPMALYNYVLYDRTDLGNSDDQAIVVLDIGAENSDVVVCTRSRVWQRCVPMGGNAFTRAIAETFKLNFEKAEKLKRTASMSKYARQIFQAMRPVFTDLASEIQRSLGFYTNANPNTKLTQVIAFGGGTKMRGLLKYLQQTLQLPVKKPDAFKKLVIGSEASAAKFHENVSDFGVVYGLAVQGLDVGRIESNLLPTNIAKSMLWASKSKYFTAAMIAFLVVSLMCFGRVNVDRAGYKSNRLIRQKTARIISASQQANKKLQAEQERSSGYENIIQNEFDLLKHREVIPQLYEAIISTLPNQYNNPEQTELYKAFDEGDIEDVLSIPRKERKQLFITGMSAYFTRDVETAVFRDESFTTTGKSKEVRTVSGSYGSGGFAGYNQSRYSTEVKTDQASGPGFVVILAGYSPYGNIEELLDPAGVADDRHRWGFVTRLIHLDDIVDGNSPFQLFKKVDLRHFQLETGQVHPYSAMPAGISVLLEENADKSAFYSGQKEKVLIDPMTKEIISKIAEVDQTGQQKVDRSGNVVYKVNDHWFIIRAKFVWLDAPQKEE
ncbi:MAG: type IV pilus assembly protein PilM [Planctomycetota bacterium]|jgi:type IV pilus assembly protein PilM